MPVITFTVTDEQAAQAREYAVAKGYGRPSNLARVAMVQLMSRYPMARRSTTDGQRDGKAHEGQRGVQPNAQAGQERTGEE